jgi:hypothetical protein
MKEYRKMQHRWYIRFSNKEIRIEERSVSEFNKMATDICNDKNTKHISRQH